jgi:hypothetical protein
MNVEGNKGEILELVVVLVLVFPFRALELEKVDALLAQVLRAVTKPASDSQGNVFQARHAGRAGERNPSIRPFFNPPRFERDLSLMYSWASRRLSTPLSPGCCLSMPSALVARLESVVLLRDRRRTSGKCFVCFGLGPSHSLAKACCEMSRRDGAIPAWHEYVLSAAKERKHSHGFVLIGGSYGPKGQDNLAQRRL